MAGVVNPEALSDEQRGELEAAVGSRFVDGRLCSRAQMVLWWDEGRSAKEIAVLARVSENTVRLWPGRYAADGLSGLDNADHPGKGKQVDPRVRGRVLALSRSSPPPQLGVTHWSSRLLAGWLKRSEGIDVSHTWVADLWRETGLQPWRQGTFKLSRDPEFAEKVADVVGLYLHPPAGAVVLSVDERSQIQALDRTAPVLPGCFGRTEKVTHDYVRNGTTTLFAALEVTSGKVFGACYERHTSADFIDFMDKAVAAHADREVHVVLDNFSAHKTAAVGDWLLAHPNVSFHYTPTSGSWLNQVEIFFGVITKQAIRRGTFTSVAQLIRTIDRYIASYNTTSRSFAWTADAKTILTKVRWVQTEARKLTGH